MKVFTEKDAKRFWDKVSKTETCWLWTASTLQGGYGGFYFDGKLRKAHRIAYEQTFGAIPAGSGYHGTCVLHRCDNTKCVRPDHLFLGTNHDNVMDMLAKGRNTKGISASRATIAGMKKSGAHSVSDAECRMLRQLRRDFHLTYVDLAKLLDITDHHAGVIVRRKWRTFT